MADSVLAKNDTHIALSAAVVESSQVSVNVGQEFITTTRDKTELALIRYDRALRSRDKWIAPLGVLLAVLPSLLGAQFGDFLGIKRAVWEAAYMLVALGSTLWLVQSLLAAYHSREQRGIARVIKEMREGHDMGSALADDV